MTASLARSAATDASLTPLPPADDVDEARRGSATISSASLAFSPRNHRRHRHQARPRATAWVTARAMRRGGAGAAAIRRRHRPGTRPRGPPPPGRRSTMRSRTTPRWPGASARGRTRRSSLGGVAAARCRAAAPRRRPVAVPTVLRRRGPASPRRGGAGCSTRGDAVAVRPELDDRAYRRRRGVVVVVVERVFYRMRLSRCGGAARCFLTVVLERADIMLSAAPAGLQRAPSDAARCVLRWVRDMFDCRRPVPGHPLYSCAVHSLCALRGSSMHARCSGAKRVELQPLCRICHPSEAFIKSTEELCSGASLRHGTSRCGPALKGPALA